MKISCPACAAKYSIADEKVQDKLAKIRCRKCGTTIVIDGKVSPPSVYAGDGGASQTESPQVSDPNAGVAPGEYSVDFGDGDQRSLTVPALVNAYNAGEVTAETYVWTEGMDDWLPLGQVPDIVNALHAASDPAAAASAVSAASAASAPMEEAPGSSALESSDFASQAPWQAAPAVESPSALRAAAKPGGGRGSTADLFGSFESAGSEADVTTSAPGGAPAPAAAAAPAASAPSAGGGGGGTGARNESSVLFSLSALTASAGSAPSTSSAATAASTATSGGATSGTKEDSGLIDLKALTAAADAPAASPIAPLAPSPLGMAPLGFAPPLGGGVEAQIAMPVAPQKSRTGLYIGGGIAVAAIAVAIAIVATSKDAPPPAPTVAATQAPPPATTAPPPATTQEETTAKPPATGTAEEDPKKAPKVASGGRRPAGGTAKPAGGTAKPAGGTAAAAKPAAEKPKPKPSGGCGCAPGDLQCAMRCAAGGG